MRDVFAKEEQALQSCACSFFDLIDRLWLGHQDRRGPIHRFCTLQRKLNAKSFLEEDLVLDSELSAEVGSDLSAKRLTFFSCLATDDWGSKSAEELSHHLLGYVVIVYDNEKSARPPYVFEAVVVPPSITIADGGTASRMDITNYYIHNTNLFYTTVGTSASAKTLTLRGSYFCQQNGVTSSCAHAALRMAINSSDLFGHVKLSNTDINNILKLDSSAPNPGLSLRQIREVIENQGGRAISANFHDKIWLEYDEFIYPMLESGLPVILGVEGWDPQTPRGVMAHVVSVVGHTLNTDRWEPEARVSYGYYPRVAYLPVSRWVDHYVICDDNLGMYVTVSSDMLRNILVPTRNPNLHVTMACGIVPMSVEVDGYAAERRALGTAEKMANLTPPRSRCVWLERLIHRKRQDWVVRTQLVKGQDYAAHIRRVRDGKETELKLSEYVWVSEISLPQVYAGNKGKLGDVVLRSDVHDVNREDIAFAWLPGISWREGRGRTWEITNPVPLLRLGEPPSMEW